MGDFQICETSFSRKTVDLKNNISTQNYRKEDDPIKNALYTFYETTWVNLCQDGKVKGIHFLNCDCQCKKHVYF